MIQKILYGNPIIKVAYKYSNDFPNIEMISISYTQFSYLYSIEPNDVIVRIKIL